MLFLVVKILAINIKKGKTIKGTQEEHEEIHITQMAGDTTLFVRVKRSLEKALSLLQNFYQHAGLNQRANSGDALRK